MKITIFTFKSRREVKTDADNSRRGGSLRPFGIIVLVLAGFLAWQTNWFHAPPDLSHYPEINLSYTNCTFERVTHYRGATTKQIVFHTADGRYVMEDGVWGGHFDGPALAAALSEGGTVRAWVHPSYPRALRGVAGGKLDLPPEWGLEYDRRNGKFGIATAAVMALAGIILCCWKR